MTPIIDDYFKSRAFSAYFGSDVAQFIDEQNAVFGPLVIIEKKACGIMMPDNLTISYARWEYCKLILHDMSQISEEHKIFVAKISNASSSRLREEFGCDCQNGSIIGYTIATDLIDSLGDPCRVVPPENYPAIIDFLRSKSYYIPFMGVDLVKEGIAMIKE